MNKKHKHCELIKAWADGAEIEERWKIDVDFCKSEWSKWAMFDGVWTEENHTEYRIKPEPKPDIIEYWQNTLTNCGQMDDEEDANLKLTFDGETGELKSAEVLK